MNIYEQIIDRLAKHCNNEDCCSEENSVHSCLIGDVLERTIGMGLKNHVIMDFICHWAKCGFTKSLQTIYAESGVERGNKFCTGSHCGRSICSCGNPLAGDIKLKSPQAQALFDFLLQLFPTPEE